MVDGEKCQVAFLVLSPRLKKIFFLLSLGKLKAGVKELRKFAWANSTMKTREYQWKKYFAYCERVDVNPIPIDPEIICTFLLHLALQGLKYSTINNEVSALVLLGKLNDSPCDLHGDFNVHLTLKALRRILGDHTDAKDELFPSELLKIKEQVNMDVPHELTVWTGILFLYRSLLRKGHIFSGEFDINLLKRREVEVTVYGLLVSVNRSKTIQFSERNVLIPICYVGGPLCIVTLLKEYMTLYPAPADSPLLTRRVEGEVVIPSYSRALLCLKRWGAPAGIKKDLGLHSLRRGAATMMSMAGLALEDIKDRGDCRSTAVLRYLAYPLSRKINIDYKIAKLLNTFN